MNPEAVTTESDGWFLERGDAGSLPLARSIRVVEIDQGDAETVASRTRRQVRVAG
jgi:hypothetical protein